MNLFGLLKPNIRKMKAKGDFQGLIDALQYKKDPTIRTGAAAALRQLGDVRSIEPLLASMADESANVQSESAAALVALGLPSVPGLVTSLKHPKASVRACAARALGELSRRATQTGDVESLHADGLAKALREGMELLLDALKDGSPNVRRAAHDALGLIVDPRITERLVNVLRDKSAVPNGVLVALINLVSREAMGPLVTALRDKDADVRRYAEIALRSNVELKHSGEIASVSRRHGLLQGERADEGFPALISVLMSDGRLECFGEDALKWGAWWRRNAANLPAAPEWVGRDGV